MAAIVQQQRKCCNERLIPDVPLRFQKLLNRETGARRQVCVATIGKPAGGTPTLPKNMAGRGIPAMPFARGKKLL
jgi:hypothetical protein